MTRRRGRLVALGGAGIPPAAKLARVYRITDVDRAVTLVVAQVARGEVSGARGAMDGPAIDEPELMRAA